jgi:hypothetical protein
MSVIRAWPALAVLVMGLRSLSGGPAWADEGRFLAALHDGSRVSGPAITEWFGEEASPKLAGRAVFDANNPFRWLLDREQPVPGTPEAYVEFSGGDRLPGRVLSWVRGDASPYEQTPDYFEVEVAVPLDDPRLERPSTVRVAAADVRRIAWVRSGVRALQPGTLFLRDGRQMPFRSLRWTEGAVTLLTEAGIEQFPLSDLAEVHFPAGDPWDDYFNRLATLTPLADARLIRVETADGLRATTSTERFAATVHGNRNTKEQYASWYQRLQPAWALDPFWVRFPSVRSWLFFEPHRVPLSLVAPSDVRQESVFGSGWTWRLDRTVHGQTLRSGGDESPQGFGVHAWNELEFELPAAARSFRTRVGLDHAVGDGGCVRARVRLGGGATLFESPVLIGSASAPDSGDVAIPAGADRRLVLAVDPVATGRPSGADPFDVRDSVDWLDPVLTLDAETVRQEVRRRAVRQIPALAGWTGEADGSGLTLLNDWDETFPDEPQYRLVLAAADPFVVFSRKFTVGLQDRFLSLHLTEVKIKGRSSPETRVQVRIDGRAVAEFTPPASTNGRQARPFAVPLRDYREREVTVEVVQFRTATGGPAANDKNDKNATAIDWRGLATMPHRPGLLPLFDEQRDVAEQLVLGEGTAEVVTGDASMGQAALKVTPPGRGAADVPAWRNEIRQDPRLGEYAYLEFAWKKSGGKTIALEVGHDGEFGADPLGVRPARRPPQAPGRGFREFQDTDRGTRYGYRFVSGPKDPKGQPFETGQWIADRSPDEWSVQKRHIAEEFGEFTLTGLNFLCPDGEAALFDGIFLARSNDDLREAAERRNLRQWAMDLPDDSPILRRTRDPAEYTALVSTVAPLFSCAHSSGGVTIWKEFAGRQTVLQTAPSSPKDSCVLVAAVTVPQGRPARLRLGVTHPPKAWWDLTVMANGEKIHTVRIGPADEPKWHDVEVDLSRFAGQDVFLKAVADGKESNNPAYWHRVEVVTQ